MPINQHRSCSHYPFALQIFRAQGNTRVAPPKDGPFYRMTGEKNLLRSLPLLFGMFKFHLIAATVGRLGVLSWDGTRFILCPGFQVKAVDTTGAGDIFHGAFLYGLLRGWPIEQILEFGCAAAALNCDAMGARGGIAKLDRIDDLRRRGDRSEMAYSDRELNEAAVAAKAAEQKRGPANPHGSEDSK